ncbi:MAG: cytochrome c biogenesis CcdA family protein [Candidatus Dojkabacteria bacterium]
MYELILAFFAGVLTVLAPCVLPILPIILGSSTSSKSLRRPLTIIGGLAVSIFILSIVLLSFGQLADLRTDILTRIAGVFLAVYGLFLVFPSLWDSISIKLNLQKSSDEKLQTASAKQGFWGDFLVGVSLGPVFNSCSPVYFILIVPLLQQSLLEGIWFLFFYITGLSLMLLLVALFGYSLTKRLKWAVNPRGVFRRGVGVLMIIIGIMIIFSLEKQLEAYLLENTEFYLNLIDFEQELIR